MKTKRGFRIRVSTLAELSRFMDDFRSDATRILAKKWMRDVAKNAVQNCDLAHLGIQTKSKDFISDACVRLNNQFADINFRQHNYNCHLEYYLLNGGVFAIFEHGDKAYQEVWSRQKRVEFWGWSQDMSQPKNLPDDIWALRKETWNRIASKSKFGLNLTFSLFEPPLPKLSWKSIADQIPTIEERALNCLPALLAEDGQSLEQTSEFERQKLIEQIKRTIPRQISSEIMKGEPLKRAEIKTQAIAEPTTEKNVQETKKEKTDVVKTGKVDAYIDHADVILASDGRTFIAVPSVGLAVDTRIFVQVTSKDVSFNQSGVNFGTVSGIPQAARDHLKACREAILVEVEKDQAGRLLRAKFIAIVTDITFSEHSNHSLIGFKRPSRTTQAKEIEEWDKKLRDQ